MEWMRNSLPLLCFTSDISSKGEIKKEKEKVNLFLGFSIARSQGEKREISRLIYLFPDSSQK
jgi:hypothetical protein